VGGERGKKGKISELRWMEVSLHFLSLIHTHTRTHQIQHKYRFAVIPDQTLSFFSLTSLHSHQDRKDGARGTTVGTKRSEGESRNKVSSMEWTLATHTHTHTRPEAPTPQPRFTPRFQGLGLDLGLWMDGMEFPVVEVWRFRG
jgi:hypothetical protein